MPTTKLHEGVQVEISDIEYQPRKLTDEEYARWNEFGVPRAIFYNHVPS